MMAGIIILGKMVLHNGLIHYLLLLLLILAHMNMRIHIGIIVNMLMQLLMPMVVLFTIRVKWEIL